MLYKAHIVPLNTLVRLTHNKKKPVKRELAGNAPESESIALRRMEMRAGFGVLIYIHDSQYMPALWMKEEINSSPREASSTEGWDG